LEKTQGYIVAITSLGAQLRVPGGSDGCITKHAVNRLVEFIALGKNPYLDSEKTDDNVKPFKITDVEHPSIRVFALAPGYLPTRIAYETGTINDKGEGGAGFILDTLALPASTMLHLTSGRLDWLSGRFVEHLTHPPPLFPVATFY
jgi:NAD(P)-dependent dehydrogenase (short-subunit alcohol dehydrogenase family)